MVKIKAILVIMLMLTGAAQAFTLDAGPGQQVTGAQAVIGIQLDSTISDPNIGENFVYNWSGPFKTINVNNSPAAADPIVTFSADPNAHILTLDVTSDQIEEVASDVVPIFVEGARVMVTHLAIDAGEFENTGSWPPPNGFLDSSREGDPDNHSLWWIRLDHGWEEEQGVVGCVDGGSLYADDDGAMIGILYQDEPGFNNDVPHLDNIRTGMTLALWYKGENDKSHLLVVKEDTFAMRIDRNGGDMRTFFMKSSKVDYNGNVTGGMTDTKSRNNDFGDDLESDDMRIRQNDGNGDDNSWHHLAMSYNALDGVVKHYVDGVKIVDDNDEFEPGDLIASYMPPFTNQYVQKRLSIGGHPFDDDLDIRRGGIDDIRIYNYALEEHEVAELASMGESVAMVYAGSSMTDVQTDEDPNGDPIMDFRSINAHELPVQLDGSYIRLGRGIDEISDGGDDYRCMWEQGSGPGDAIFANRSDPATYVTFTQAGNYSLRLYAYGRFCGEKSEHYDSMTIQVNPPTNCAGYLALGGDAGDLNSDCDVDVVDLQTMGENWLNVSYP